MQGGWPSGPRLADASGGAGALDGAIQRLEAVVDQETAALRAHAAVDLNAFNNRKSQGLLELNRALRSLGGTGGDAAIATRLAALRAKLDVNRTVLKMHLDAVREISNIMADAIREAESDGTYTPTIRNGAQSRYD
jgi:hypothetical protein